MSNTKFSNFKSEDGNTGPDLVGITTFTSPYYFVPPSGTTAQRPSGEGLTPGMLRFNTDIGRLEVWRNDHWATILGESPNLDGGNRGLFGGGSTSPASVNDIDQITLSTLGNATDFGNTVTTANRWGGCSSRTRGYWFGGASSNIDTAVFSSTGNASSFGTLTLSSNLNAGCSNSTRGLNATAGTGNSQNIDYFTLESTGTAVSFGNLTVGRNRLGSTSNSVRGIFAGGYLNAPGTPQGNNNTIDYVTISTTGNAQDFGDSVIAGHALSGLSNSTRGIFASQTTNLLTNTIQFITISTTGNAQDFGDLTVIREYTGSVSSPTRGVIAGGLTPTSTATMDYITIASTGNAINFGDLTVAKMGVAGCSNGHGGL